MGFFKAYFNLMRSGDAMDMFYCNYSTIVMFECFYYSHIEHIIQEHGHSKVPISVLILYGM